eukprot:9044443-Lingulodinium_polyedra.AAC.1
MGEEASLEDWALAAQAKAALETCARRFLGDDSTGEPRQPKLYRRATHWLARALDHALVQTTSRGLEAFVGKGL